MKRVKIQPRQHTILVNDDELNLLSLALHAYNEANESQLGFDNTGQDPFIPVMLLQSTSTTLRDQFAEHAGHESFWKYKEWLDKELVVSQ